jgi:iron complex transport system substrate-binding protein
MTFFEQIETLADLANVEDAFDAEIARYEARIADAQERIGNPEKISISQLDINDGGLRYYPRWGALAQVIDDIGFAQPAIQAEATANMRDISFERLMEFDGDILITGQAWRFGQDIAALTDRHDTVAPFWRDLPGVEAGNHYWYYRDLWNGNTFVSLHAVIDGLELLTAGRDFD